MHWDFAALLRHELSWGEVPAYVGGLFVLASFLTKTMIPLRALSLASNVCFIVYGLTGGGLPTLVLYVALLPLNALRLRQMVKLVQRVRLASRGDRTMDWLKPYMKRRRCRRGDVLFRKGDTADAMFYVVTGGFRLLEIDLPRGGGDIVGELGLLAPDNQRTQTMVCEQEGEILAIRYDEVRELFFQNPDFGFYFMQLAASRLFHNLERLERQVANHALTAGAT